MMQSKSQTKLFFLLGGWLIAVAAGFFALLQYGFEEGGADFVGTEWPQSSEVTLFPDKHTLVVSVHPRCPCTQATVSEIARLAARTKNHLGIIALAYIPEEPQTDSDAWKESSVISRLKQIPSIQIVSDPGGDIAKRFGAVTSGDCRLYNQNGNLTYRGGVTPFRGHEGDSLGIIAIESSINNKVGFAQEGPVYGCPITEQHE